MALFREKEVFQNLENLLEKNLNGLTINWAHVQLWHRGYHALQVLAFDILNDPCTYGKDVIREDHDYKLFSD